MKDKPDLGAASVPARDWFEATKGVDQVEVAYFSTLTAALYAKKQLVLITKSLAKTYGLTITDYELRNMLRLQGPVLYWWTDYRYWKPAFLSQAQACIR